MSEQTPYDRMRFAADWLEANGIDWAMYDLQFNVISLGHVDPESNRLQQIRKLCKGLTANVSTNGSSVTYTVESDGNSFGFRWYVWNRPVASRTDQVVSE